MKKNTIRNIILGVLGAFLVGLGIDININSIGMAGVALIISSITLAVMKF